jgi:hypothetical protein
MPALKNIRHEAFAQAFVRGQHAGNSRACYRFVYKREDRQSGWKLLQRRDISLRIHDIEAETLQIEQQANEDAAKKLGISKEWVLERLIANVERPGKRKYDPNIAAKCLELLGKHVGMFIASDAPNVNVNVGVQFVDHPPAETRAEWEARRRLELAPKPKLINGNGKAHS